LHYSVTAVNAAHGHSGKRTGFFRLNGKEWGHGCGFERDARQRERRANASTEFTETQARLPSGRTTDLDQLILRMAWAAHICDFGKEQVYGSRRARRSRKRVRCRLRPRMMHRTIQVLVWNFTKIVGRWGGNWLRWLTLPNGQAPPRSWCSFLAFGNASLGRGSPIPRRHVFPSKEVHAKANAMYSRRGVGGAGALLAWDLWTEFRSSQVHSRCWENLLQKFTVLVHTLGGAVRKPSYELLSCPGQGCRPPGGGGELPVQRDKNAARCICAMALCDYLGQALPEAFTRAEHAPPPAAPPSPPPPPQPGARGRRRQQPAQQP
jgi:hypothetical protein